jgi:2'-5' RNA ligase
VARDRASRPQAKPQRLFVALKVPEEAKPAVSEALAPWRAAFPKARWVPPENWHVTLKFLGGTYPRLVGWMQEQLVAVAAGTEAFPTRLSGLGCFPSPGGARVVWAGLEDSAGRAAQLAMRIDDALSKEIKRDHRPFRAHVTVARSEPPLALPADFSATQLVSASFSVGEMVLFRSHLRRPSPRYEPIQRIPFGS